MKLPSKIPRWLKIFVGTILAVLSAVLILVFAFLIWIVSDPARAWRVAERHLLPEDLKITWEKIEYKSAKENGRHWQIEWLIEGLEVRKGKPEVEMRFDRIRFDFGLKIWVEERWFTFRYAEILGAPGMRVKLWPSEKKEPELEQSPYEMARGYMDYLGSAGRLSSVDNFRFEIPDLTLELQDGPPVKIFARAQKPPDEKSAAPESMTILFRVKREKIEINLAGELNASKAGSENDPFFTGKLAVEGVGGGPVSVGMQLFEDGNTLKLKGNGNFSLASTKKPIRFTPDFEVRLSENAIEARARSKVVDIPGPLVELNKVEAAVDIPVENGKMWSERPSKFEVWSMIALFFIDKDMREPLERECRCKIPEFVEASVNGRAWLKPLIEGTSLRKDVVEADIRIESISNKFFSSDIGAKLRVAREKEEWIVDPVLDSELTVHSYQGLRKFLDAKGVIVPAPFDVLEGTLKLTAKSPIEQSKENVKLVAQFSADLNSPNQNVNFNTKVAVDLDRKLKGADIFVSALIKQFQIELPPLDPIRGVPPVTRDRRVRLNPRVAKKSRGFKTQVYFEVKTESSGAIRLLNKFAKPHIPVTVNVKVDRDGDPSGFVRLEPFTISYLRRNIAVEKLHIGMSESKGEAMPVDGRFHVDQTDYKVFIDVAGSLDNPNVQLSSEPYLPRNDIISVLLYDRTSEQLISADSETVGSFEAALADRAIGLFGLWAFASTPIKSFTYNPVTKVYVATVDLGGGLTAGVGTNTQQAAHLEIRKRVSKRWVLTASWIPTEDREQVGKLVLQWEKRFN